ncbi:heavy metal translocating P-type ATPase [Rhodoferax sp. U11-2br]|uniref:heavy metal translocating P-type ATPase n=1 Tax=Rhodoferax sp. U11-2br TaxID=2838878 RepID=UPI001BEB5E33|nr:heavy metal translocating P-type ATPase [Rhodoferax sp. U11-2br]MBT3068908.1 heavy metal translocating P-type ATPase [Rhodoferax sp. U11-2br]
MPPLDTPHSHDHKHGHDHEHGHHHHGESNDHGCGSGGACCGAAHASQAPLIPVAASQTVADGQLVQTPIRILQMDCPTEEALLQKKLGAMTGVVQLDFNLMQRVLTVTHAPSAIEPILDAVRSLGFTPELASNATAQEEPAAEPSKPWWPLALGGLAALGSEALHWAGAPTWLVATLALVAVLASGLSTYKKGWIAVRNGNLNINALMSIAVTGALLIGQWPEAAMVMVLFTVAELIEAKSLDRARHAIRGLMQLTPERATVKQPDGSWLEVAAKLVPMGAQVRIKPGEHIALDGRILSGRSSIDQAAITGESLPVDKTVGDEVFAGTLNTSGSFDYSVTAAAKDSTLARIIHAVEAAQGARAPTQRFVDQFARIYTPVVFALALLVAVLPPLLSGADWLDWVYKALVLLVIACPCALVISTPVTIVSGLAAAARKGILVKGGVYLEQGRKLRWLALDKTGTLTHGKPIQTDFVVLNGYDETHVRSLAASLAQRSDHPVSRALWEAAQRDGVALREVSHFEALPGRGTQGVINGKLYHLGNHRLIHEQGRCSDALEARLSVLEEQGKTVILLTDEQQVHGLFAVADSLKDSSREAIAELHALGIQTLMLTGDNAHTARAIAAQAGITEARGDLLPEDKRQAIEQLIGQGGLVGMVGDGINDAPALARADIGFAMGAAGTGTAIETADVALMDDDLRKLPRFVRLSRDTHSLLVQNIVLALGIKLVFLVLTLSGNGSMWMAVFADVGASLLVVGNGLRLLRK